MSSPEVGARCDPAAPVHVRRSGAGLIETVVDFRMVLFRAERDLPWAATGFPDLVALPQPCHVLLDAKVSRDGLPLLDDGADLGPNHVEGKGGIKENVFVQQPP